MYQNSPKFRYVIYIVSLVATIASFFVRAADNSGRWAEAVQDTADFLGGLAAITAASNVSHPTVTRIKLWFRRRRRREHARSV